MSLLVLASKIFKRSAPRSGLTLGLSFRFSLCISGCQGIDPCREKFALIRCELSRLA
ncbi:hypothetical protein PSEWESI4_01741 [Pseudomonas carbonaria]|uniref:Uncharacterized protein n=1 Tax=Zestomonas carbonaria TaxID=2762745 RepID=A0A7U7ELZ3_9GAMM|nr:hypothetical protein PSEWESI4_01741 [Pseudomonas carbonaria]